MGAAATKVVGVGIDIVDLDEIEESLARHGERYLRRVYTERECASWECARRADVAGRNQALRRLGAFFAVKEATLKVLEPDDGEAVSWRCIHVQPGVDSERLVELTGAATELAVRRGIDRLSGSVHVTRAQAIAVVFGGASSAIWSSCL